MVINIKNMVCNRCIMVVQQTIDKVGVTNAKVKLGSIETYLELSPAIVQLIDKELQKVGFEIISNQSMKLVEQIKNQTINYVYGHVDKEPVNFSTWLASNLNKEYNYLSYLFSSVENITIEHYLIRLKIEKVKELLVYDEKTLSEIAFEMGYSSVAHLSGQFKKVTGFTPSYFKNLGEQRRKSIDEL